MKIYRGEEEIRPLIPEIVKRRETLNIFTPFSDPERFLLNASLFQQEVPIVVRFSDSTLLMGRLKSKKGFSLNKLQVVHNGFLPPSPDHPYNAELLAPLLGECARILHVEAILWNHERNHLFQKQNQQTSQAFIVSPLEKRWTLNLPGKSYSDFTSELSKKARYNLKRSRKKLAEAFDGELELETFTSTSSVLSFVNKCEEITKESYHSLLGAGVRNNPSWISIIELEAKFGRFLGLILIGKKTPICYQLGTIHGSTFNLEATSFLPEFARLSPGGVLQQRAFEVMYERGLSRIDYGFGDAPYKQRFGAKFFEEQNSIFFKTPIIRGTQRFARSTKSVAKRLFGKRIKNWIKTKGRG